MPHRAENVGSLVRPPELLEARVAFERGELTPAGFRLVEDRAVDAAIALQEACDLDILSDGEMRLLVFTAGLLDSLDGIDGTPAPPTTWRGAERYGTGDVARTVARHSVSGPLRRPRSLATEEFTCLRARTGRPAKATTAAGNPVTPAVERAKLELVGRVARRVWS